MSIFDVNDRANLSEMIVLWSKALGRSSIRNKVFDQINSGKRATWSAAEISAVTGIRVKSVLDEGKRLVRAQLVLQEPGFPVTYRKREIVQTHKRHIKRAAASKKVREGIATKQNPRMTLKVANPPRKRHARARFVSPDVIEQFSKMKSVTAATLKKNSSLPPISEEAFKLSVIALIGEPFQLKDWGGEQLDIFSTRPKIAGSRKPTGFALKGPGSVSGLLTPAKMGKNGDQIQRLIDDGVELAVVQYEGQIGQSINTLLARLCGHKALQNESEVLYTVIDREDSLRLRLAYPRQFAMGSSNASAKNQIFAKRRKGKK